MSDGLRSGDSWSESVRLGIVGLGWFGAVLTEAARASGQCDVVACYARTPEARAAFATAHGCRAAASMDELLSDTEIDGLLIATPHSTHATLIEEAADAGKHVFVEKPLALTVADGRRAMRAAQRTGVVLQVGHNRRRQPANRRIKAMIDRGELGTVLQLEGNHSAPAGHRADLPAWRSDPAECPAGGMTGLGIHVVDTHNYLAGPIRRLTAFSKRLVGFRPMDEATTVIAELESGPLSYIGTSYYAPAHNTIAVYGTECSVWNEEDGARLFVQRRGDAGRTSLETETADTIQDELREFASCIQTGTVPETGAAEGLEAVAVLEAIVRSAATSETVELSEIR